MRTPTTKTTRRMCWKKDWAAPCATENTWVTGALLGDFLWAQLPTLRSASRRTPAVGAFLGGSDVTRLPHGSMPTWVRSRKAMAVRERSRL